MFHWTIYGVGGRQASRTAPESENCCVRRRLLSTSDDRLVAPVEFTYESRQVEIVLPDDEHLIGDFWQIKIDGVLERDVLYSSLRVAATAARKLIDQKRGD